MKRLRTFDEYWKTAKHPSANEAWRICAEEREAVIRDLRKDLRTALSYLQNVTDAMEDEDGGEVYVRDLITKWDLYNL